MRSHSVIGELGVVESGRTKGNGRFGRRGDTTTARRCATLECLISLAKRAANPEATWLSHAVTTKAIWNPVQA
jgi:hypothetical protein